MNIPAESDEQAVPPTEDPREEMTPSTDAEALPFAEDDDDLDLAFNFDGDDEDDDDDDDDSDDEDNDDDDEDEDEDEVEWVNTAVPAPPSIAAETVEDEPVPDLPDPQDPPVTRLTLGAFEDTLTDDGEETRRPVRIKKQRRQPLRTPRKNQPTLQQVTDRFAACGRCSYFWAGYRVLFGLEELETAVAHSKSGWLELMWDEQMPELVVKSYGARIDMGSYHYESCCQECRRHFIYQASDNEDEADAFRIEITPYMAK